jgi:DNA processing protein
MKARDILIYLSLKYEGDYDSIIKAIRTHEPLDSEEVEKVSSSLPFKAVTILDDNEYPDSWKHCFKTPLVVFYYGDISLIKYDKKCVSIVGSREASPYGIKVTKQFARRLAKEKMVVVSGLARGIDASATEACIEEKGKAVGILGSGIDVPYPSSSLSLYEELKRNGLLLSEYPGKCAPKRENFPMRNRLIAATGGSLIVGEAGPKSGTLITVGYALSLNKDVGCVPYPSGSDSSCNRLIKEGAYLLDDEDDVMSLVGKLGV